jgi:hypothetical protein
MDSLNKIIGAVLATRRALGQHPKSRTARIRRSHSKNGQDSNAGNPAPKKAGG